MIFSKNHLEEIRAILLSTKNEYKLKQLEQQLNDLENAKKEGFVLSNKLKESREFFNGILEVIFDTQINNRFFYAGKYKDLPEDLNYIDSLREVRLIKSYFKKINKISEKSKEHQCFKEMVKIIEMFSPLQEILEELKGMQITPSEHRAQNKLKEEEKKREDWKKQVSHEDVQKVIALLEKTSKNIWEDLYNKEKIYLERMVENIKSKAVNNQIDLSDRKKFSVYEIHNIRGFVEETYMGAGKYVFNLRDDLDGIIEALSKKSANRIVDVFVKKNTEKISYILIQKNNLEKVDIENICTNRGSIECDLKAVFRDGSEFIINTSVVFAVSKLGKGFYRYPSIFKNVKQIDGTYMKDVCEEKMESLFALNNVETNKNEKCKI